MIFFQRGMLRELGETMTKANSEVIAERLKHYPDDVASLALEALQLSTHLPEQSVAEKLENTVRRLVRDRNGAE